ncbi:MAG TPA: hypothetical protein VH419_16235, partial [Nocardioidaceae bacterium]
MASEPKRIFLHIGLHKTGTTYLQNLMRVNRAPLCAAGVHYPGATGEPAPTRATRDLLRRSPRGYADPRIGGSWDALVATVRQQDLPTVVISDEGLGGCRRGHVRRIVESFADREVHAVLTVRDLARVVVSEWQEEIKNDRSWTWQDFVDAVRDEDATFGNGRAFWRRQDLVRKGEVWLTSLPAAHVHIVTVPKPGSPDDELVERFMRVVNIDRTHLPNEPEWNNESVGVAGTEVIRRMNERMGGRLNEPAYNRAVKATLVPLLAQHTKPARFTLPVEELGWVSARADQMIEWIKTNRLPVSGDLEDLRVSVDHHQGRRPDDVTK